MIHDIVIDESDTCYGCDDKTDLGRWRITLNPAVYYDSQTGKEIESETQVRVEANFCHECLFEYRREGLKREMVFKDEKVITSKEVQSRPPGEGETSFSLRYWAV